MTRFSAPTAFLRISKIDVTPSFGVEITGHPCYLHKPGKSSDRLWAKALVLEHGKQSFVLVTVDCIWISESMRWAVLKALEPYQIKSEFVMLSASHTHSGPQTLPDKWALCGTPNKDYLASLNKKLEDLISAVFEAAPVPVEAFYGETSYSGVARRNKKKMDF